MEKTIGAIPPFYACYLLRSIARHSSLYVGSTPNPVRRLRQHNGDAKGGAARTSKDTLRPWEMTCLVTGFPSKIAALQFEWAWQNPSLTRHIAPDLRITEAKMVSRISPRTGKMRKRSTRPRMSLTDRIANLHLLLQSKSFNRWPLKLIFFAGDVFRVWERWVEHNPGTTTITASLDKGRKGDTVSNVNLASCDSLQLSGIQALDVTYSSSKSHIEKSLGSFAPESVQSCFVCATHISPDGSGALVCSYQDCSVVTHLQCLSALFLNQEGVEDTLVPKHGQCPGCHNDLQWVDLVKDLSLRMRGEKEIATLLKPKRARKRTVAEASEPFHPSDGESLQADTGDELDWNVLSDSDGEKAADMSPRLSSGPTRSAAIFKRPSATSSLDERVIEDSDWDEAEIIT